MEQAPIFILDYQISEPTNALTDFIVSATAFYAWWKIRSWVHHSAYLRLMSYYFLLMGISTFMGGIFAHAILHWYGHLQKVPGWLVGMVSMFFLEQASIYRAEEVKVLDRAEAMRWFSRGKLAILLLITIATQHLNWVGIQSVTALFLFVLPLHWRAYRQTSAAVDRYALLAIACSLPIFVVSAFKLSLHHYFNFNDISHIVMVGCILLFYRACRALLSQFSVEGHILQ
ncbi:MAG: hypothetical protein AAGG75_22555 [Bacteroidota bacterium]